MNFLKRGLLYITRKKFRSFTLLAVILVLASFLLIMLGIKESSVKATNEVEKTMGGYFIVRGNGKNPISQNGMTYGQGVSDETFEKLKNMQELETVNAEMLGEAIIKDLPPAGAERDPAGATYGANATTDSATDKRFLTNAYKLSEGRHITPKDKNVALITKETAERGNLKVGDTIDMGTDEEFAGILDVPKDRYIKVKVIGIMDASNAPAPGTTAICWQPVNQILIDFTTYREKTYPYVEPISEIKCYVKDSASLEKVAAAAEKLINSAYEAISINDTNYQKVKNPVGNLNGLVNKLSKIISLACGGIILLLLLLWTKSRVHEIGVLLAAGIRKKSIVLQFIFEVMIISLLALSASYFTADAAGQNVSDSLVESVNKQTNQNAGQQTMDITNPDAMYYNREDISKFDVKIKPSYMLQVTFTSLVIIILGVTICSVLILRYKPKEILSKMS